jgi:hypothetical protein
MNETKLKFCINCKYFESKGGHNGEEEYDVCNHKQNRKELVDLVRGTISFRYAASPQEIRKLRYPNVCGREGKWFEQK